MNTEQNYVGKGDSTNNYEQSANTASSTDSMAKNRSSSSNTVEVNRQVYEAQIKLLTLVSDFIGIGNASQPVEVINDLLYRWLTSPSTDLALDANRTQLFRAQQLINFLAELAESAAKLEHMNNINTK